MKLGKNQAIALAYVNSKGVHAPKGSGSKPWQLGLSQYRQVLDSLVKKGLVKQLASGCLTLELRVGAVQRFTPNYVITPAGIDLLIELREANQ